MLVDAYCGAGFFAKALLDRFERVIGIDWDRFAIEVAKKNATAKETYIAGDIEAELRSVLEQTRGVEAVAAATAPSQNLRVGTRATTLLVDPPATGLSAKIRETIVDLAPSTLIYVSCNPPTLARDLAELQQKFRIESVTPLDMFPQTAEIEVVVHLGAQ